MANNQSAYWNGIHSFLSDIDNRATHIAAGPDNEGLERNLQNSIRNFQNHLDNGRYISSKSALAEFIFAERETNKNFAVLLAEVAIMPGNQQLQNNKQTLFAVSALSNFERNISKRAATASGKTIERIRGELEVLVKNEELESSKRLDELDGLIALREQKAEASTKTMATTLGKHKSNTRNEQHKLRDEVKEQTDALIQSVRDETETIKETYESKMALQAPIQYWKDKSKNHKWATIILAGLFILYSALAIWALIGFILAFDGSVNGFILSWKGAGVGPVASFAGLIGLGMIFARIFYRLFSSQLHLWNDASERVIMIQTYLSMAQQGHAKEEFLGALLHRLFSPSADGIVKSDLGAVGPIDGLASLLRK